MSFREALQEPAAEFFRRAIRSGKLAHAYILVGPRGVGKRRLAKAVASYLFCSERNGDACGKCRSCRLIESDRLADLHWYSRPEGKAQLTVEIIEDFQRTVNFKPVESEHKVFVLEDADKLNPAGANKLLKVLEEPPPDSLILLLALDVRDFLPTILSRCHVIRLRPMPAKDLAARLQREKGCTPAQARYLSLFTMGSGGLADELATPEFFAERDWLVDAAAALREGTHFQTAEEMFKRSGAKEDAPQDRREMLLRYFDVLALFYRDVLAASLDEKSEIVNADRASVIRALSARLAPEDIRQALVALDRARQAVAFNANQKLLLENLAFDIAKVQTP